MAKIKIFTVLCLLPVSLYVTAQVFNAGAGAGMNISQVDGDGFKGYNKAGPAFGLFVNTFFSDSWSGQMEINFSSKGSRLKSTLEYPVYYGIDLRYVEIPVSVRYLMPSGFIIEAGLSGGYLFYSKEKDELGELPESMPFRKTEFAALGGLGYFLTERITVNGRISYSVIPVRDHAGGGTYYFNRGQNNNVLSFILQYSF